MLRLVSCYLTVFSRRLYLVQKNQFSPARTSERKIVNVSNAISAFLRYCDMPGCYVQNSNQLRKQVHAERNPLIGKLVGVVIRCIKSPDQLSPVRDKPSNFWLLVKKHGVGKSVQASNRASAALTRKLLMLRHAPGRARTCNPMIRSHKF